MNLRQSLLLKNPLTLWGKFFFERLLANDRFLTHGRRLKPLPHPLAPDPDCQRVLFPTAFFLDRGLAWQTTIAKALEIRGHEVTFMPMDLSFPRRNALYFDEYDGFGFMSRYYRLYTRALLDSFSFHQKPYSHFGTSRDFWERRAPLATMDRDGCQAFQYRGYPLGQIALNPLIHHFRCGTQNQAPAFLKGYRDYLAIGTILIDCIERAFDQLAPSLVFMLNGSFLDSHLQLLAAQRRGIRVVTFEAGFMLNSLMLGINEPIISFPMTRYLPPEYQHYQLTQAQEQELSAYLETRSQGKDCVFDYWGKPIFNEQAIRNELGLPAGVRPDILFTNLLWDSSMLDCDIGFHSQLDWILETIRFYTARPERTLLVRVHPAEINPQNLASTDRVVDAIAESFPTLPANVIVVPPTSSISSYPLTQISDRSLIYSSTAGLEAAMMGKTAVIAGKTHFRGQGFTTDVENRDQYFRILEERPTPKDTAQSVRLARRYAYFFFFGFMLPFDLVTERVTTTRGEQVSYAYSGLDDLAPRKNPQLDLVLDLILGRTTYTHRLRSLML